METTIAYTSPREEAIAYARTYTGRWEVMQDIQARVLRYGPKVFMSDKQVSMILASKAREASWAATPAPVLEPGFYLHDGTIYRVQKSRTSGNLYALMLVVDEDEHKGTFEYAPGATRRLAESDRLTAERAAELGQHYGLCVICGATLTDPDSVSRGIGPVCIRKVA